MVEYRKNAHSVWDVKYHVIWVTKYRYKVLRGEIAVRTRDLLRQICQGRDVVIVQGSVSLRTTSTCRLAQGLIGQAQEWWKPSALLPEAA
jgi:putative transposase